MAATIADLGVRVLRRLGITVVAGSARGATLPVVSVGDIAARVLRTYGIPTASADRPSSGVVKTRADVARTVLQRMGVNLMVSGTIDLGAVTLTDISDRVLVRLGVIAADETPTSYDRILATNQVKGVHEQMQSEGLVPYGDATIPRFAAELYSVMAAIMAASSFGRPVDLTGYEWAKKEIRRLALSGASGQAIAEREVSAVNAALSARGLAWWADNAVPDEVFDDVVLLCTARVGPTFGQPLDPASADAAEARIRQAAVVRGAEARATQAVTSAFAELQAGGLSTWNLNAIPAGASEALETLAAVAIAGDFGKPADPEAHDRAMRRLRQQILAGPVGQAIAEGHVWDAHADLDARGRTRWAMEDRPDQVDQIYVVLAACRMAPEAGVAPNSLDVVEAERMLSRIIALPPSGDPVRVDYF